MSKVLVMEPMVLDCYASKAAVDDLLSGIWQEDLDHNTYPKGIHLITA